MFWEVRTGEMGRAAGRNPAGPPSDQPHKASCPVFIFRGHLLGLVLPRPGGHGDKLSTVLYQVAPGAGETWGV